MDCMRTYGCRYLAPLSPTASCSVTHPSIDLHSMKELRGLRRSIGSLRLTNWRSSRCSAAKWDSTTESLMCCGTRTTAVSMSWMSTRRRSGRLTADWMIRGGSIVCHGSRSLGCATRSNVSWVQSPAKVLLPYGRERLCFDESLRLQLVTAHGELTQL